MNKVFEALSHIPMSADASVCVHDKRDYIWIDIYNMDGQQITLNIPKGQTTAQIVTLIKAALESEEGE